MANINGYGVFGGVLALLISILILSKQQIYMIYEALAVPFGAYFIWYGLTQAKGFHRYIFTIFGAGNIIVDGYLLLVNYGVFK